jgi:hypothetical protein
MYGGIIEGALGATETTETQLGTHQNTLGKGTTIRSICGTVNSIATTGELPSGKFRLAFKTIPGNFEYPLTIHNAPAGTLASPGSAHVQQWIPVSIPFPANEIVTAYATLNVAQTGAQRVQVGLLYA